ALAGGLAALSAPAFADAPMLGPLRPVANRVKLGAFEVTTILDGAVVFDGPYPIFGGNASEAEVQALAAANGLPTSKMEISFTPTIANTGSKLVLFDTGNGAGARPGRGSATTSADWWPRPSAPRRRATGCWPPMPSFSPPASRR
ncbi:MAG: hypothetical protein AAFZ09_11880, partial [Pseudomonadota bacterium]